MEAERYPDNFDGILAGAPAIAFGFKTFVRGDFRALHRRNGKIIIYHGGDDVDHSLFKALERWVEQGVAPTGVTARKFAVEGNASSGVIRTRRVRPYAINDHKRN